MGKLTVTTFFLKNVGMYDRLNWCLCRWVGGGGGGGGGVAGVLL